MLYDLLKQNNMSVHQCSKKAGIPYMTLLELVHGKTSLLRCNTSTAYRLAKALNISMEELIEPYTRWEIDTGSWDNYKSTLQHMLQDMGDKAFIRDAVKNKVPFYYYQQKKIKECLYLVSMTDYLCRINHIKPYAGFGPFRSLKLENTLYPTDILLLESLGIMEKSEAEKHAIPEFLRHNIIEGDIRNVC